MKNIQIVDGAKNATLSIFQATNEEFAAIFPGDGQDIETRESFVRRVGRKDADHVLGPIWQRPVLKSEALGIHGTLYYVDVERRKALPRTKREIDYPDAALSPAQRSLFAEARTRRR